MSTLIRPELSKKNKYYIERHRYYELSHFCLQYGYFKKAKAYYENDALKRVTLTEIHAKGGEQSDIVAVCAQKAAYFGDRIEMIERAAAETDKVIGNYILQAVTSGRTYDTLNALSPIPCGKDAYYELYRKFFYILDKYRQ